MSRSSKLRITASVVVGLVPALLLSGVSAPILYGGLRLLIHGHVYEWRQVCALIVWPAGVLLATVAGAWIMFRGPAHSLPMRIVQTVLLICGVLAGLSLALLDPALLVLTIGPVATAVVASVQIWRKPRDAERIAGITPETG